MNAVDNSRSRARPRIVREGDTYREWADTMPTQPAPLNSRREPQAGDQQDWSWLDVFALLWPFGWRLALFLICLAAVIHTARA